MDAADARALYDLITQHGISTWLVGGWGVDALLGRQTRAHKDLDVLVTVDDVDRLIVILEDQGYAITLLWPDENTWLDASTTGASQARPTAFVMSNPEGCELDVHVLAIADDGTARPLWRKDVALTADALKGEGWIDDRQVACISLAMQLAAHSGYEMPEAHREDVRLLRALGKGDDEAR